MKNISAPPWSSGTDSWKEMSIGTSTSDAITNTSTKSSHRVFRLESGSTMAAAERFETFSHAFCLSSRFSRSESSLRILSSSCSTSLSCVKNSLSRSSRVSPARFISSSLTFASATTCVSCAAIDCFWHSGCSLLHSSTTAFFASFHLLLNRDMTPPPFPDGDDGFASFRSTIAVEFASPFVPFVPFVPVAGGVFMSTTIT